MGPRPLQAKGTDWVDCEQVARKAEGRTHSSIGTKVAGMGITLPDANL